jgi:hemerythrin-like domain-containing protein
MRQSIYQSRRQFLQVASAAGAAGILSGFHAAGAEAAPKQTEGQEEISPNEDLMREHGVLNRVLLVYEESVRRLAAKSPDLKPEVLSSAANIIRRFIEEYHEKLEEDYLFTRFEKAGKQMPLVRVLREQHEVGRRVTQQILALATLPALRAAADRQRLSDAIQRFIRMYRPHESREDTILFPAFRGLVSGHEFDALGEEFEKKEHQLFGEDGFEKMVDKVADLEKALGIYDLSQFTPKE